MTDVLRRCYEDASDFQTTSTCQDGLAYRNKSCVSCSWNLETTRQTDKRETCHEDLTRMIRGCYEETAIVKFRLYNAHTSVRPFARLSVTLVSCDHIVQQKAEIAILGSRPGS